MTFFAFGPPYPNTIFKGLMLQHSRLMIVSVVFGLLLGLTFRPSKRGL